MDYPKSLKPTKWVFSQIFSALEQSRGFSLIRLGDGEALAIAHDKLIQFSEIPQWLKNGYVGISLPNKGIVSRLVAVIKKADIVGVPVEDWKHFKPLMLRNMSYYNFVPQNLCHSRINFHLYDSKLLHKIIENRKIIVVGRKAKEAVSSFSKLAKEVKCYPLNNLTDLDNTFSKIKMDMDFSIALVAAGIPAKILCVRLAVLGKIAIDIGHVLDAVVNYRDRDILKIMARWQSQKG